MIAYFSIAGNGRNVTHQEKQSPVPYLIAGVSAMLGLIVLALFILACSVRKPSAQIEESNSRDQDIEAKVLVIMAGDENPTFLANPVMTNAAEMENRV